MNQHEHRLQAFVDRFLDRVVMPPFFTSGVDAASKTSDNARARAAARGIKFGLPDVYLLQGDPTLSMWIELKVGANSASDRQRAVGEQIMRCGVRVSVCRTIEEVHMAIHSAGFRLHGNAWNIAAEMTARWQIAEAAAAAKSAAPKSTIPTRAPRVRPQASRLRKIATLRAQGIIV